MMDFVIRISPEGDMEFRRSEGEKKVDCGDGIKAYLYGVVDAPEALCQMAAEDDGAFPAKRHEIIGAYTLVTVDEAKKRLRLYRSSMGGNKPVYYAAMEDGFYIFSSIKCLKQLGYQCAFNDDRDVVCDFIYNGFIRTKDTLIRGIYKLLADEYIAVDSGNMAIGHIPRILADASIVSLDEMYETEKRVIHSYIDMALGLGPDINIAISGGYDSNLILHFLKERGLPAHAFSVGGQRGLDETETARKLCEHSGNAAFHKGSVGRNTLSHMKEIAEALEGEVYERGVFLQYSLGKLLQENGVRCMILGEGSDQVFNRNFYVDKVPEFLTNYMDDPYELGIMLVMKKSYMMLEHFGIVGLYPFIHEDMQHLGAKIFHENGTSKIRQKEMCNRYFDDYMNELIAKNPGSTSLCALFESKEEEEKFIAHIKEHNAFYDPAFRISYKYGSGESELDYYLCLEYLKAFKEVFCD